MGQVFPRIPWILIFVIGNAFNEGLLFRGLFMKKFDPFIGRSSSNLVIAIPFGLHHSGISFSPDAKMFLANLFPLALTWDISCRRPTMYGDRSCSMPVQISLLCSAFFQDYRSYPASGGCGCLENR
jgi:hypothetical protein